MNLMRGNLASHPPIHSWVKSWLTLRIEQKNQNGDSAPLGSEGLGNTLQCLLYISFPHYENSTTYTLKIIFTLWKANKSLAIIVFGLQMGKPHFLLHISAVQVKLWPFCLSFWDALLCSLNKKEKRHRNWTMWKHVQYPSWSARQRQLNLLSHRSHNLLAGAVSDHQGVINSTVTSCRDSQLNGLLRVWMWLIFKTPVGKAMHIPAWMS